MARLIVEWSTQDPQLAAVLRRIAEYPEHSAERMELEATLHAEESARLMREAGARRGAALERQRYRSGKSNE